MSTWPRMKPICDRREALASGAALISAFCGQRCGVRAMELLDESAWVIRNAADEATDGSVISAVALHPQTRWLASVGDDHAVRMWDLEKREVARTFNGHDDWVRAVAFSPDGKLLATGGNDRRVMLWDLESGLLQATLGPHAEAVTGLAFGHTGGWLAVCGFQPRLYLYELPTLRLGLELEAPCQDTRTMAFSPRDTMVASGGRNGRIRVHGLPTGKERHAWQGHSRRIRGLAFSPDGTRLASCAEDRWVYVWSLFDWSRETELATPVSKNFAVTFVAPDRIATAGTDNRIHLWDLNERRQVRVLQGHTGSIATLAARGDTLVSGSYDTTVRVWRLDTPLTVSRKP